MGNSVVDNKFGEGNKLQPLPSDTTLDTPLITELIIKKKYLDKVCGHNGVYDNIDVREMSAATGVAMKCHWDW